MMKQRFIRLVALAAGTALVSSLTVGMAAASVGHRPVVRTTSLTIHATGRNGEPEQIYTGNYIGYGTNRVQGGLTSGLNRGMPVGRYAIAVVVPTISGGIDIADTIVARTIDLRHPTTVTLSAQHSVQVQVSLDGSQLPGVQANVCANSGRDSFGVQQLLTDAEQGSPNLYVTPVRSKTLRLAYQVETTGSGGAQVNLAGSFAGIPAKPDASFSSAGLAKVDLRVTAGAVRPWNGSEGDFLFSPDGRACGGTQWFGQTPVLDPSVTTEYFSPGPWQPTFLPVVETGGAAGDSLTQSYGAGHTYNATFYGAAWGPNNVLPTTIPVTGEDRMAIRTPVNSLIGDPAAGIWDPDGHASVRLSAGSKTLVTVHYRHLSDGFFSHVVHHTGWYTLRVAARRLRAQSLMSPRVTITWHFYDSLFVVQPQVPVSYTRFLVRGLNLGNQAAPGSHTTIGVVVTGPTGSNGSRTWRTVRIQASFNNGLTWQPLRLVRHGHSWTVTVPEPAAANVSLRSTVVNARGDSTVETIYDAYSVD